MTMVPHKVLVVEDELQIAKFLRKALEDIGCQVFEANNLNRSLIKVGARSPDLVLVDLGLPDGDGIDLIKKIRSWSVMPIIVVSARGTDTAKIAALDAGADDFVSKPFSINELLARVRAQLRRADFRSGSVAQRVCFGNIEVDLEKRTVQRNGELIKLTTTEYRLLAYLIQNADRALTHQQILSNVWGPSHSEDAHYVRVYMGFLRKKIEQDPSRPQYLHSDIGVGYRLLINTERG